MDPNALALQAVNQWIAQMSESEQRRMMWGSVMAKDELIECLRQTITVALTTVYHQGVHDGRQSKS